MKKKKKVVGQLHVCVGEWEGVWRGEQGLGAWTC